MDKEDGYKMLDFLVLSYERITGKKPEFLSYYHLVLTNERSDLLKRSIELGTNLNYLIELV
ncbi:MAG: hypothetical protein H0X03_09785 [Nitrosopumilus sp.]|nr:hypothetical protein [Nitrosopumilus sp.]